MKNYLFKELETLENLSFRIEIAHLQKDFALHSHDFSELVIILGGSASHVIDDCVYPVEAGDVYVLKGDTTHGFVQVQDLILCNIMVEGHKIWLQAGELRQIPGFQALFVLEPYYRREYQFRSRLRLNSESLQWVSGMIEAMHQEFKSRKDGYLTIIQSYFNALAVYLSRAYTSSSQSPSERVLKLAETVSFMEKQYKEPLKLDDLALRAHLSVRHFSRTFKENYQTTPMEYILALRLGHACNLIACTDMTMAQIALDSGFTDSNYFTRQFHQRYGLTPTRYRRERDIRR